jgi:hypothetical protein
MPTCAVEAASRKARQAQAALGVANKPPQPPGSQENGEQFPRPDAEKAGISRVDAAAERRISRHEGAWRRRINGVWKRLGPRLERSRELSSGKCNEIGRMVR